MHVAIRADAGHAIGAGHVMRCLALAQALSSSGAQCSFVMRKHPGNLISKVEASGFEVAALATTNDQSWIGATVEHDAAQTIAWLKVQRPDWLIADHYEITLQWLSAVRPYCKNILVIDDLASRQLDCDLLLDANAGKSAADYSTFVSQSCQVLAGPSYALLRPEFALARQSCESMRKPTDQQAVRLLISLGGVDAQNISSQVLLELANEHRNSLDFEITIVLGEGSPTAALVRAEMTRLTKLRPGFKVKLVEGATHMAQLLVEADIAIGAAGVSALERCCVGLPSVLLVLADNQRAGAHALAEAGAAFVADSVAHASELALGLAFSREELSQMRSEAYALVDGLGTQRVVEAMYALH
jgi:UDP-2,4-diacetamido-2,4,6-trideoxy-beta-L-altropyranose hydrolase